MQFSPLSGRFWRAIFEGDDAQPLKPAGAPRRALALQRANRALLLDATRRLPRQSQFICDRRRLAHHDPSKSVLTHQTLIDWTSYSGAFGKITKEQPLSF